MKKLYVLLLFLLVTSGMAHAECKVEEVVIYVNQMKLDSDEIRSRCRNRVNVPNCSLSKVINMIKDGKSAQEINNKCK